MKQHNVFAKTKELAKTRYLGHGVARMTDETIEEDVGFLDIEELQNQGIGMADITKLKTAGIHTVSGAQMTTRRQMTKIKGLSEAKIEKIKEACAKLLPSASFQSAIEISQYRKRVCAISTGSKAFDAMLGGGIMTMSLTEVFGEFRCGKTQLAHTMCVTAQLPKSMGGAEGKAAYIDTEGTFRPDRCRAIAERFGVEPESAMENIVVNRCFNTEMQQEAIDKVCGLFAQEGNFKLLVIDSIMALFRVDYSGRGELADRQQKLNVMLSRLCKLSEEFNVAVFLTNQVQSDPGAAAMFASADRKPVGGHILAHASATRILLRKGRGEERVAKIQDSPDVGEGECVYVIKAGGICDSE